MDSDRINWASLKKKILGSSEKSPNIFSFSFFCRSFNLSEKDFAREKSIFPNWLASVWQVFGKWLLAATSVKFLVVQWKPSCNFLGLKQVATVGSNFHGQCQLPNVCKQKGGEAIKDQCKPGTATIAFKVKRCNFNYSSEYFASVGTEVDICHANTWQPPPSFLSVSVPLRFHCVLLFWLFSSVACYPSVSYSL